MSAPIRKGGKPSAFGAKLRIYAAHNPTILQMVANLSMPMYYRFHFPTWMETHKGLKNCFCPLFLRGQGDDRSIFFIRSFASDRRRKVRRRLFTIFSYNSGLFAMQKDRKSNDIRYRGKKLQWSIKWKNEWMNLFAQKNIFRMIY